MHHNPVINNTTLEYLEMYVFNRCNYFTKNARVISKMKHGLHSIRFTEKNVESVAKVTAVSYNW